MAKAKLVTGLFKTRVAAESAVDAIIKRGYTRDDISVLMSDATKSKEFALETRTHAAGGVGRRRRGRRDRRHHRRADWRGHSRASRQSLRCGLARGRHSAGRRSQDG